MQSNLYYVHDPMCSWCWAFRAVYEQIIRALPAEVNVKTLLGGLAPDSDEPMPQEMKAFLQGTWKKITERVPGTRFNVDFWSQCQPRRSTYPACRAVIAARLQGDLYEPAMIKAIQEAYYLRAMNPSDDEVLITLADELGLNRASFTLALRSSETQRQLEHEMMLGRSIGAEGFPSLILERAGIYHRLRYSYTDPTPVLAQVTKLISQS
jgi:putative protein-disulfide isomerase